MPVPPPLPLPQRLLETYGDLTKSERRLADLLLENPDALVLCSAAYKGKTLLVISHDEEYYEVADRVLRLRDGTVGEEAGIAARGIDP